VKRFSHYIGSRERAYVYAISSAGAAYAITRACSRGEITECGCDGKIRQRPSKGFEWGGCSEVKALFKSRPLSLHCLVLLLKFSVALYGV